jgi:3-carboxy-cis,cis-muconate cycloisomerase
VTFDLMTTIGADGAMAAIFGEDRAVRDWLSVEAALTRGLAEAAVIDGGTAERIVAACGPQVVDRDVLWSETALVGYPILPLVRMICAALDETDAGYVHWGATTQDIMDCALALQMRDAADRLLQLVAALGDALSLLVERHAGTVMPGRTHAQQAVPTTFGAKCAVFLDEFTRHRSRLLTARRRVAVVSLFGAGGTSAALGDKADVVSSTTRSAGAGPRANRSGWRCGRRCATTSPPPPSTRTCPRNPMSAVHTRQSTRRSPCGAPEHRARRPSGTL